METIRCTLQHIVFQNAENGYSVFQVKMNNGGSEEEELFGRWETVVGTFSELRVGALLSLEGEWRNDKKYGRQFAVTSWSEELPADVVGLERYLASGMIKGIGSSMAKRIVSHFGMQTMEIIEKFPDRLREVSGIGKDRVEKIQKSWEKQKAVKDVMVFLQGHGVSATYAVKIFKQYGKESIQKVKDNPYALADDIFGIGFKMADTIAEHLGYTKNDHRRLRAGISFTLTSLSKDGHCFAEREQLIKAAMELLEADREPITVVLSDMIKDTDLYIDGEAIYLPMYFHSEINVAEKLRKLLNDTSSNIAECPLDIDAISEKSQITYDDVQVAAIKEAMKSKVMVLTGGPGTGKTTTTLGIIAALESLKLSIVCAAPTGRAAKRMSEATGKEAKTIHRLLEFKPQEGYGRNEDNPIDGDVLIVDESSMIDILLMNSLLKAVPDEMRLILVGDIDQLPSVGAGNVLRDVIDSGVVPVVRLTRIFRQAQSSRIVTNAHKVNQGIFPDVSNGKDSDFFFINDSDAESVAAEIVNIVKNRIPKAYGYSTNDIQVLVPMRKGVVGAIALNAALQEAINPVGDSIPSGGNKYRQGDRVMQIKNDYDKGVFNGDVGFIESIDFDERILSIRYDDRLVEYEDNELGEITLAYACTIHKSQGSEYPVVVIPIMMSHYVMLQRNLVYTGITRAKKLCILIGESKAIGHAVRNYTVMKRNTKLRERMKEK